MMSEKEYIEREAVMKIIDKYGCAHGSILGSHSGAVDVVGDAIYKLPAADVAPVKHGHWRARMSTTTSVKCTCCNCYHEYETPYCPNCGAKMDGDVIMWVTIDYLVSCQSIKRH